MKRLKRKVHNSAEKNCGDGVVETKVKSQTLDRHAFTDCSSRMKRLVPTLHRGFTEIQLLNHFTKPIEKGSNHGTYTRPETFLEDECSIDSRNKERDGRHMEPFPADLIIKTTPATERLVDTKTSVTNSKTMDFKDYDSAVDSSSTESRLFTSATLPSDISSRANLKKTTRRKLLKPLSAFASVMSDIGGHIQITSYPSH